MEAIRNLAARYAIYLDSRDLESLVALFVEDVKPSPSAPMGREALRDHFRRICQPWGFTVHQVCQQAIDFETSEKAMGHVYCRAEHIVGEKFVIAAVRYLDRYERRDGKWYFRWRRSPCWYISDMLERPTSDLRIRWPGQESAAAPLPESWDTFVSFYANVPPGTS